MAEIEFKQKSNWIRSCKDGFGLLDCEWDLIWFPISLLSYFKVKLSFQHFFQGIQIFSVHFMVWQKNNEILLGGGQNKFVSRARGDSWHLFIANFPNFCFSCWFFSLSSETCLTNSISFSLLNWQCELGRVRILHSRSQHLDRQTPWLSPSQMTSFLWFCHMQSKSKWIWRVSATAFVSCSAWPLMGALRSVSLFQKSISTVN